jgi:hypothetical protein
VSPNFAVSASQFDVRLKSSADARVGGQDDAHDRIEAALRTNRKAVAIAMTVEVQASERAAARRSAGSAGSGMGLSVTGGFS